MKKIYHGMPKGPEAIQENFEDTQKFFEESKTTQVLWEGATYMTEGQKIALTKKLSETKLGLLLLFKPYTQGQAQSYSNSFGFIPKIYGKFSGQGISIPLGNFETVSKAKYLYVTNTEIMGSKNNENNKDSVLAGIYAI